MNTGTFSKTHASWAWVVAVGCAIASITGLVLLATPALSGAQQDPDLGNITLGVPLTINLSNCPDIYQTNRDSFRGRFEVFYDAGTSGDSYTYSNAIDGENLGDGNYAATLLLPIDGGTLGSYKVSAICDYLDSNGQWIEHSRNPTVAFIPLPAPPGTLPPEVNDDGVLVAGDDPSLRPAFTG